ncbi:hypothetical protein CONCODRAFT_69974 [Conidiobolus coronatus NRRL 28638]|uniref:Uncharacterized protein n=1 Tax=Conidiobolus coronatus (strain ATCC 28846 / CBS 209.66 / NRRL 28638) TaxID=796925 RepID=A0A137P8B2_CONC2|nr:hypothetical protein CONCODRAFT_69974 [Conidiobolus coronatus NRRL 28638]|eukprot:KXN71240.1 hypothetical protein CONCODRAFT_69974 [Conidiobolus coronatus NRRL 28638]
MKFTKTTTTVLLLLNFIQSDPLSFSGLDNLLKPFNPPFGKPSTPPVQKPENPDTNPNQPQKPQQSQQPQETQQSQLPSNSTTENKHEEYGILSGFLKIYGTDIGTKEQPKMEQTAPTSNQPGSSSIMGFGLENIIQAYFDRITKQLNEIGLNFNSMNGSKKNGQSIDSRIKAEGGEVTIYKFVDIIVDFVHENKDYYSNLLDVVIIPLLKKFPFLLDLVFKILDNSNPNFNNELTQLIMDFLYKYEKHSQPRWVKISDLIIVYLNKDLNISATTLRNIVAIGGRNPV